MLVEYKGQSDDTTTHIVQANYDNGIIIFWVMGGDYAIVGPFDTCVWKRKSARPLPENDFLTLKFTVK